jgi:hypothetical protein
LADYNKPRLNKEIPRPSKVPIAKTYTHAANWSFSFKYFDQMTYFGLKVSKADPQWFLSLLLRLKDLSRFNLQEFRSDSKLMGDLRYHEIDWNSKNIPIKRIDINWVDKNIIENDEEFPFFQIMLSMAIGRIVGFWDVNNTIFNIVLLDPMHNIQPSKNYDYIVTDTRLMPCKYTSFLQDIENVRKIPCVADCNVKKELKKIPTGESNLNVVHAFIDDSYLGKMENHTLTEIIEAGIELLEIK